MSQSTSSNCKAIIEQGAKKGNECDRPRLENGYCGKHHKQAILEKSTLEGNIKCSKYRCVNIISATSKYCDDCIKEKDAKMENTVLCKWAESKCKSKAKDDGYCGKHTTRAHLLGDAEKKGVRICDDGKRACKNNTEGNKLKCEECLKKDRIKDNTQYNNRKDTNLCTQCGIILTTNTIGIRDHQIQKCKKCYLNARNIEDNRIRQRNYSVEKKMNPQSHFRQYIESASKRNLNIGITLCEFIKIVNKPCYYCEYYSDIEVIGIDRVDSSIGYINSNIVPCCEKCNIAKGEMNIDEFKEHITKIYNIFIKKEPLKNEIITTNSDNTSYIRPTKIVEMYIRNKLDTFIDLCIKDNRSPLFINKLKELSANPVKVSQDEFKRTIKIILSSENRSNLLTEMKHRKRIPRKEIIGFLNSNNIDAIVNIYENTFGTDEEIKEDFIYLGNEWKTLDDKKKHTSLEKLLIKYQNKRAKGSRDAE